MSLRKTLAAVSAVVALTAVGIAGVQYAGATPTTDASPSAVHAKPNVAIVYNTTKTGGMTPTYFYFPNPGKGAYQLSFTANFAPKSTAEKLVWFSCSIIDDETILAQDTTASGYPGSLYAGVNGSYTGQLDGTEELHAGCSSSDLLNPWAFGSKRLQVTVLKLDKVTSKPLT